MPRDQRGTVLWPLLFHRGRILYLVRGRLSHNERILVTISTITKTTESETHVVVDIDCLTVHPSLLVRQAPPQTPLHSRSNMRPNGHYLGTHLAIVRAPQVVQVLLENVGYSTRAKGVGKPGRLVVGSWVLRVAPLPTNTAEVPEAEAASRRARSFWVVIVGLQMFEKDRRVSLMMWWWWCRHRRW